MTKFFSHSFPSFHFFTSSLSYNSEQDLFFLPTLVDFPSIRNVSLSPHHTWFLPSLSMRTLGLTFWIISPTFTSTLSPLTLVQQADHNMWWEMGDRGNLFRGWFCMLLTLPSLHSKVLLLLSDSQHCYFQLKKKKSSPWRVIDDRNLI